MKISKKIALPIAVVALAALGTVGMIAARPSVATRRPEAKAPLVRIQAAQPGDVQLRITAQGSVVPRTESELVAEASGRITQVSPSLASGGFFAKGDVLVRIDPSDYEVAVDRARAALSRTESELGLARSSLDRRRSLAERGVASSAALDDAQNAARVAEAARREAAAALVQARADLKRTHVRAPFDGRVRDKRVDVGQFVARGAAVARVYAVDYAEVRLPIPDAEAAFVDLPIAYRDQPGDSDGPEVALHARFAGRDYTWWGRIVRTEGELDPQTRMIHAVARVEDPYGRGDDPDRPPLAVGLFVTAEIQGRSIENVVAIPRTALRGQNEVVLVDAENRLRIRRVEVLRRGRDRVLISQGISAGDRVCTSPLSVSVEGMLVRTVEDTAAPIQENVAVARSAP